MRLTSPNRNLPAICLAVYGCGQLERVADFINSVTNGYSEAGVRFTTGQIAGQYAFEQVKLDRKGYDSRRLMRCLSILADAGASFPFEEALVHAEELINNFTADFGHDEDGDATFRIKAQSYRLKKYDCHALWSRISQAQRTIVSVSRENLSEAVEEEELSSFDDSMDFRLTSELIDAQGEHFATIQQYFTVTDGYLCAENLLDFEFADYPNFHDESGKTYELIAENMNRDMSPCVHAVKDFILNQTHTSQDLKLEGTVRSSIISSQLFPLNF